MLNFIARHAKTAALLWLLFITVLFLLPGSAFPKDNWLQDVHFDKWMHFSFFALLLFLWRFYLADGLKNDGWILFAALGYGVGVEFVQHFLVANRSFDGGDVVADMAGAVAGLLGWRRVYKKNRPL